MGLKIYLLKLWPRPRSNWTVCSAVLRWAKRRFQLHLTLALQTCEAGKTKRNVLQQCHILAKSEWKKTKKTNNVPANADRLYQFHEALVFVSWYRLTSYLLLRVLACSSFNRVSPPFQRRSSRHAGTAEQSAAYVLVTEASCFAQSAPSLPTTSCLGAAMLQQCQLSTSPRARHITGKSVCLSAKISACSWIYECVWNGFWCLCVHLCPCQKGLPDVWL